MTNAEAIAMLKRMQEPEAWEPQITEEAFEALDMAIEALSNKDVVYRQAITCDGCKFVGTYDTDFPCYGCIRREKDYYEPER